MQRFYEFKENNKHLLFSISFLILLIISCTQLYFLEGSILNFFYKPFLINFFGLSALLFLIWILGVLIAIYYISIDFKDKKNIIFIFIFPVILIVQISSLASFFNYYNYEGIFKFSYGGLLGEYLIKFPSEWDRFNPSQLNYALGITRFLFINFLLVFIFFPKKIINKTSQLFFLISNLFSKYKDKKSENKLIVENIDNKEDFIEEALSSRVEFGNELIHEDIKKEIGLEDSIDSHTFTPNNNQMELWDLPNEDLLNDIKSEKIDPNDINEKKELIEKTLSEHGIEVSVDQVKSGPSVTMYGLTPGFGNSKRVRVDHILAREKDLALALANQNIRFQSPMPGESLVGIEVPNKKTTVVGLKELISDKNEILKDLALPIAIGTGSDNSPLYCDLTKLPHLLVAGATGS